MLHFFNAPPNCTVETLKEVSDFVWIIVDSGVDLELFRVDVDFDGLTGLPVFDLQPILHEPVLTLQQKAIVSANLACIRPVDWLAGVSSWLQAR